MTCSGVTSDRTSAADVAFAGARAVGDRWFATKLQLAARLDTIIWQKPKQSDRRRINRRLARHRFGLLTFLEHADVPADNNTGERDIRSNGWRPRLWKRELPR